MRQFKSQNNLLWQLYFFFQKKSVIEKYWGWEKLYLKFFSLFKGKVSGAGNGRNKKGRWWNGILELCPIQVLVTLVIMDIAKHMPCHHHISFIFRQNDRRKLWVALSLALCFGGHLLQICPFVVGNVWNSRLVFDYVLLLH